MVSIFLMKLLHSSEISDHSCSLILRLEVDRVKILRISEMSFLNFLHNLLISVPTEWWIAADHNVSNDSNTPDITFVSISSSFQHFGSNIVRGSKSLSHLGIRVETSRSSKINNLYSRIFFFCLVHDVLRFEISMYNIHIMTVANPGQNLLYNNDCILFIESIFFHNSIKELSSFTKLSHNIESLVGLGKFKYLNDIRVGLEEGSYLRYE